MRKIVAALFLMCIGAYAVADLHGVSIGVGTSEVKIFDVMTPAGHACTIAMRDDYHSSPAMFCWK